MPNTIRQLMFLSLASLSIPEELQGLVVTGKNAVTKVADHEIYLFQMQIKGVPYSWAVHHKDVRLEWSELDKDWVLVPDNNNPIYGYLSGVPYPGNRISLPQEKEKAEAM